MSCGCSNTTPTVTTTNCGSCGYNCSNCTCPTNPIIEPAVVCADPEPCSELFPLECVIYTGEDIACAGEADTLYPNVIHYLVLENSSTTARNFVSILNNINKQLCYLFSKNYISQLLTNIQNDETLTALFCSIASSCNCTCNLTCGTVNSATYNASTSAIDTIGVNFAQVTGGNSITFQGTISGTTLSVTTPPGSGAVAIGQKITGSGITNNTFITANPSTNTYTLSVGSNVSTATLITAKHITYKVAIYRKNTNNNYYYYVNEQNSGFSFPSNIAATASISVLQANDNTQNLPWLVTVQATDELADLPCTSGFYPEDIEQPVPVSNYDGCGFGLTIPVPTPSCYNFCLNSCSTRNPAISSNSCYTYWGVNGSNEVTFTFTHNQPANTYLVTSYTFHWYVKTNNAGSSVVLPNDVYEMPNGATPYTVNVNSNGQSITGILADVPVNSQFDTYLLIITPTFENPNCPIVLPPREFSEEPNPYLGSDILRVPCNWFIYDPIKK